MIDWLWLVTLASLIGTVANIYKKAWGISSLAVHERHLDGGRLQDGELPAGDPLFRLHAAVCMGIVEVAHGDAGGGCEGRGLNP